MGIIDWDDHFLRIHGIHDLWPLQDGLFSDHDSELGGKYDGRINDEINKKIIHKDILNKYIQRLLFTSQIFSLQIHFSAYHAFHNVLQ